MGLPDGESARRFAEFAAGLASTIGNRVRGRHLKEYCTGLLLPGERKSVEPIAAKIAPAQACAAHQSLLHFVNEAEWPDERMLAKVCQMVLPAIERHGPIEAWIVDDTSFPKKGKHSVGVARQYCGQLGKQENCQVAVSLSIANHHASLPVAYRLYLPQEWVRDAARCAKAKVPPQIRFKTKPEIALDQLRGAAAAGLPRGVVVVDPGYGNDAQFRTGVTAMELRYMAGVRSSILVWPPGTGPRRRHRLLNNTGRRDEPDLISVKELALRLPNKTWRKIGWREGSADRLSSRFARVRVRAAHTYLPGEQIYEEWLLIEWPKDEDEPTKYWLSTLPPEISFEALVDTAKLRWRIERDYLELKQEIGLGHYEGRGWVGFHHHATLSIASYAFLISERETIPPSGPACAEYFEVPRLPQDYRPRGSPRAA
jgi:SRSO17 transposase